MKKKISTVTGILIALTLLGSFVSAFGVSYIWGSPLQMKVGETRDIYITLQNRAGELGDVKARVELLEGQEITQLTDGSDIYLVPYNGATRVNFTVSVPEDAKVGDGYWIKLLVTTIADEESGGMGFATGSGQKIYVEVVPEVVEVPETTEQREELPQEGPEFPGILMFLGVALIIVVIVIIILIKRKSKK